MAKITKSAFVEVPGGATEGKNVVYVYNMCMHTHMLDRPYGGLS